MKEKKETIFLFGEAEKGDLCSPCQLHSVSQLCDLFGHPPEGTLGIPFAIQSLLLKKECVFFRVREEGFSVDDYFRGLKILENESFFLPFLAIGLPGVGDSGIIKATSILCLQKKSSLILTQKDLYDYLTSRSFT